ncbi:phosphate/phosphite/phosphonate ABC transporter substrate-binding protein [Litoreibacter janthinus]|nr:PhnD/SsuA/transferrin family substrate-binding protein [Litoreibacter janthinus]
MYDRPETAAANDRFWQAIRKSLPFDTPERLTRDLPDLIGHWTAPDLVLSQTCGYPYRALLSDKVRLVATPVLALDCPAGHYYSVIIAHRDRNGATLEQFNEAPAAYNDPLSQSGWAALHSHMIQTGLTLGPMIETGAHRASARAVAEGRAAIAAIDALTWQMICKWDDVAAELCVIEETAPTPTLPYICAPHYDAALISTALETAVDAMSQADRACLGLRGTTQINPSAYLQVETPPPPQN